MLWQHPIVTVDLAVAQIRHQRPFKASDFSLLLKLPWPQLVFGIFQYVLEKVGGEVKVWSPVRSDQGPSCAQSPQSQTGRQLGASVRDLWWQVNGYL